MHTHSRVFKSGRVSAKNKKNWRLVEVAPQWSCEWRQREAWRSFYCQHIIYLHISNTAVLGIHVKQMFTFIQGPTTIYVCLYDRVALLGPTSCRTDCTVVCSKRQKHGWLLHVHVVQATVTSCGCSMCLSHFTKVNLTKSVQVQDSTRRLRRVSSYIVHVRLNTHARHF